MILLCQPGLFLAICPVCKEVVSDGLGLLEFAFGQVMFFEKFKLKTDCEINLLIKTFLGQVEKMIFFAPCCHFMNR